MNYKDVILRGLLTSDKEFLESYFLRESKKAEKEHYGAGEFFKGCNRVIEEFKKRITDLFYKRKHELLLIKNQIETNSKRLKIESDDLNHEELLKNVNIELDDISKNDFSLNYSGFVNDEFYAFDIQCDELEYMTLVIKKIEFESAKAVLESLIDENEQDKEGYFSIFSGNGFNAFEYLLRNTVGTRQGKWIKNDLIYLRHFLYEKGLIHVDFERFKEWFNELYSTDEAWVEITQSKTELEAGNNKKEKRFKITLDTFQQNN